jgi:hypothetical protein
VCVCVGWDLVTTCPPANLRVVMGGKTSINGGRNEESVFSVCAIFSQRE